MAETGGNKPVFPQYSEISGGQNKDKNSICKGKVPLTKAHNQKIGALIHPWKTEPKTEAKRPLQAVQTEGSSAKTRKTKGIICRIHSIFSPKNRYFHEKVAKNQHFQPKKSDKKRPNSGLKSIKSDFWRYENRGKCHKIPGFSAKISKIPLESCSWE